MAAFGQVPAYRNDEVEMFEPDAIIGMTPGEAHRLARRQGLSGGPDDSPVRPSRRSLLFYAADYGSDVQGKAL
jgi:hypothetical protein